MSPLAAAAISSGAAVLLLLAIRGLGLWLAATHPDPEPAPAAPATAAPVAQPQGALAAVIAAAVHTTLKKPVRVVSVMPLRPPSVETLMLQWSVEGRRAIYTSHRVR